ncbi:MAG TPA: bifunctional diguanylate cyclase/phosphodiesterase [Bacillota bacterium]|nr:bifunctional diguanylate cyclase/phosphodiesterase [Clostridiaceae bacterium]HNT02960.1 bifunctional diguanylate cyclase/phosphodiesterase [Bacillota bacterium]HPA55241.1 bifunctional diguanylate cyclase/phosphodiesterase [Bacillota bacterium]HPX67766.1 bifunctional diguanylate cyclase/phosphodiesterase [Bacillota bacterium]HQA64329.1 bifunctional diguanylate cyclase/phosphodiesterase [Bacillota bacterium]
MVFNKNEKKLERIEKVTFGNEYREFLGKGELESNQISLRIALTYMIVVALWILLSDKILGLLAADNAVITRISMIKGWVYVLISGILIFVIVSYSLKRVKIAEGKLYDSCQNLSEANMELEHLAYHDQITGVRNKISLIKRINELVSSDDSKKIAILIADIDNFKYINDAMGHSIGDQVLIKFSSRLKGLAGVDSTVYRLGGDGFVIALEGYEEASSVKRLAESLLKDFKTPLDVNGSKLFITISIGVSMYPENGDGMDELLKNADIALNKAKATGKNRVVFYNRTMNEAVSERVNIEKHLRAALINNEFELYYQPQWDIVQNKVSGLEALIRWKNPELGYVNPLKFINIAEDTHMIIPIGEWVLKSACTTLKELHRQGHEGLSVSVNISMVQLLQDDFVCKVTGILDYAGLSPEYLELEITESVLMESCDALEGKLKILKDMGIKIALDDFGKGYSSLNYLKQLPISTLKIDKSFIDTIESDSKHKSLTNVIVKLGRIMGLSVVAEGVETKEQLDYLTRHRCDKVQGYLFSKPVPGEKVIEAIRGLNVSFR